MLIVRQVASLGSITIELTQQEIDDAYYVKQVSLDMKAINEWCDKHGKNMSFIDRQLVQEEMRKEYDPESPLRLNIEAAVLRVYNKRKNIEKEKEISKKDLTSAQKCGIIQEQRQETTTNSNKRKDD